MTLSKALMDRLAALRSRKSQTAAAESTMPDTFDLRLQRIGTREARVPLRPVLFRNRPAPLGA